MRIISNPLTGEQLILNANPKGCNQYSGPECSGSVLRKQARKASRVNSALALKHLEEIGPIEELPWMSQQEEQAAQQIKSRVGAQERRDRRISVSPSQASKHHEQVSSALSEWMDTHEKLKELGIGSTSPKRGLQYQLARLYSDLAAKDLHRLHLKR